MTVKLHHNTVKSAASHGLIARIHKDGDEVEILRQGSTISTHSSGSIALKQALEYIGTLAAPIPVKKVKASKSIKQARKAKRVAEEDEAGEDEAGEDEAGEEGDGEGKSIIKRKYKTAYKPFKMTCGDELSQLVSDHVKVSIKLDGKSVKRIDAVKLRKFAKANGVWVAGYENLNVGMQRMNVANRLRKLVAGGYEVQWVG